jgi:hypothetical protein
VIEQIPAGTNEPTVLECSWLPKREMMGRGRVSADIKPGDLLRSLGGHVPGRPVHGIYFANAGTLDLGIVRDSALNASNDFQVFGQSFDVQLGDGT